MRYPQHSTTLPDLQDSGEAEPAFLTKCHRNAVDRLTVAFNDGRPAAIVIGEGKSTFRFIIGKFLSTLDEEVTVARITPPCADATEFMAKIVSAAGFDPKDMSLRDLESVFDMFLSFQRSHRRRTLVCVDDVQDCDWWVLDKIRGFVETESDGAFGLTVLLSGNSSLKELLTQRPLATVAESAGKRIFLAPLTLPETRQFVKNCVKRSDDASVEEIFEYQAVQLLYELCAGVPDAVAELVGQCLDRAREEGTDFVTSELVERAYYAQSAVTEAGSKGRASAANNVTLFPRRPGRLMVQLNGHDAREIALRRGNVVIGRSKVCDICIDSAIVSRHHALITYRPEGATIIDLGSTNGTSVDGRPVREHKLAAGETITLGDCRIEYILDDEVQDRLQETRQAENEELTAERH